MATNPEMMSTVPWLEIQTDRSRPTRREGTPQRAAPVPPTSVESPIVNKQIELDKFETPKYMTKEEVSVMWQQYIEAGLDPALSIQRRLNEWYTLEGYGNAVNEVNEVKSLEKRVNKSSAFSKVVQTIAYPIGNAARAIAGKKPLSFKEALSISSDVDKIAFQDLGSYPSIITSPAAAVGELPFNLTAALVSVFDKDAAKRILDTWTVKNYQDKTPVQLDRWFDVGKFATETAMTLAAGTKLLQSVNNVWKLATFTEKFPKWFKYLGKWALWALETQLGSVMSEWRFASNLEQVAWAWLSAFLPLAWTQISKVRKLIAPGERDLIFKGIKPWAWWVKSIKNIEALKDKAISSVNSIIKNKSNLMLTDLETWFKNIWELPQNLLQFSEAIQQTKKSIYKQYKKISSSEALKPIKVWVDDILSEIDNVLSNPRLEAINPWISNQLRWMKDVLKKAWDMWVEEAESLIESWNQVLRTYYKNPNPNNVSSMNVLWSMASILRKKVDDGITSVLGKNQYQDLKLQYWDLTSIEESVTKSALRDAKKNLLWLIDYTSIFNASDLAQWLVQWDPTAIVWSAWREWLKALFKRLNDPNVAIKQLFTKTEKWLSEWLKDKVWVPFATLLGAIFPNKDNKVSKKQQKKLEKVFNEQWIDPAEGFARMEELWFKF